MIDLNGQSHLIELITLSCLHLDLKDKEKKSKHLLIQNGKTSKEQNSKIEYYFPLSKQTSGLIVLSVVLVSVLTNNFD